jgi:isochorismate pyruvate lyase
MISETRLAHLRREIDRIDLQLIELLAQRFAVVDKVVAIKQQDAIPAAIQSRVDAVINQAKSAAASKGVPVAIAEKLWQLLVAETIAYEQKNGVQTC